ncbi:MAG TPA: ABC transporter permease subunit [Tissierellales bacterium]|nr:ABC transporter permease subunit [Tissierellales bacterium]
MDLKILGYNKTLFKKDWNMSKWSAFFIAGMLFFTMTLGIIRTNSEYETIVKEAEEHPEHYDYFDAEEYKESTKDFVKFRFKELTFIEMIILALVPISIATLLFGEEKRRKTFEVLATMPFTRWEIFFNKLLVAFTNLIFPFLINALIMTLALGISKNLREFYSVGLVMTWLGANIFRLFVFLGFSFLFATLTGTSISQIALTAIFLIFPLGFMGLIEMNLSAWGYTTVKIDEILNILARYSIPYLVFNLERSAIIFHFISGILMFIFAKILFDKNTIERSGETLEFESLETFFKVGVTGCISLLTGVIFESIGWSFDFPYSVSIIIGYVVGIVLGWLIATYSIKLNRSKI